MGKRLMMFLACLFLSVGMAMAQTNVSGTVLSQEDVITAKPKVRHKKNQMWNNP